MSFWDALFAGGVASFLIGCKEESDNSKLVTSSGKDYDEWQITKEHLMRIQKAMDDALNRRNKQYKSESDCSRLESFLLTTTR